MGHIADTVAIGGDFRALVDGKPKGWSTFVWSGKAEFGHDPAGHGDAAAVRVRSVEGADAAWTRVVPVEPWSTYELSFWVRTEGVRKVEGDTPGARVNLHARSEHTEAITGDSGWVRQVLRFDSGADDAVQINCILGWFGRCAGTAWFSDLTLVRLGGRTLRPEATIGPIAAVDPISPYLYSQFIEHLGRCIQGGIWAEMLEDRKFFFPVGTRESPWRRSGGARIEMDPAGAYVNDRSPRVEVPAGGGGIAQRGITIERGRPYVLRAQVRGNVPVEALLGGRQIALIEPSRAWRTIRAKGVSPVDASDASLEFRAVRAGAFHVGAASLMPADHVHGFRRDTLGLLRELDAPLYRWPGGNFVSGYDWRDGIGDPDKRPTRRNPAWQGIESNDVGLHEFLDLCALLGTEPLVVVNTGFGDAHSAAEEVEYVNGHTSTPGGAHRARNGRKEPWKVHWWGVGNEMWGPWQLGYMALDQYVVKHNMVESAMRRVDPTIKTVSSGELGGGWTERMLRDASATTTLISEHFYCQERPGTMGHIRAVPEAIRAKAEAHRRLRETIPGLKQKKIKIAMDEWNYWYGPHLYGELGTRYYWKDGLGIAAGLHEYFRNTDVIGMANYAQTVNVIGAIKTTATEAWMETTGVVLSLYRKWFGTKPLRIDGAPDPLDLAAALTEDGSTITIAVINPASTERPLRLEVPGFVATGSGERFRVAHPDPQAYNDARSRPIRVERGPAEPPWPAPVVVPALSVTLWRFPVKGSSR